MTVIAIKGVLESLKYSSPFNEKIMQNKIDNLMISVYFSLFKHNSNYFPKTMELHTATNRCVCELMATFL